MSKGEGSRGGNVIGHTKSGKPIYGDRKSAESEGPIILPSDNSADIAYVKNFHESLSKVVDDMEKFVSTSDAKLMELVDLSDYQMFHDARRLLSVLSGKARDHMSNAKEGKSLDKLEKITRTPEGDKMNKSEMLADLAKSVQKGCKKDHDTASPVSKDDLKDKKEVKKSEVDQFGVPVHGGDFAEVHSDADIATVREFVQAGLIDPHHDQDRRLPDLVRRVVVTGA